MAFNKYFLQKCMFASLITIINTFAISLAYVFSIHWYIVQIPLLIVLFFNLMTVFLSVTCSIIKRNKRVPFDMIPPTTLGYFIPCYNQSAVQINNTLQSFFAQISIQKHRQFYFTVCDGRKLGAGNTLSTDRILKEEIFPNCQSVFLKSAYLDAEGLPIDVELLHGTCANGKPYFAIIKQKNCGKRDSITVARRLFYAFNTQKCTTFISPSFLSLFTTIIRGYGIYNIQFIVGVDADTMFQPDCTVQMLSEICRKPNIMATSGMVKVQFPQNQSFVNRIWEGYQHVEYLAGQGFQRNQQNLTQQKINCLPGCLNITRICQETSGQRLLSEYMVPPKYQNNIFEQIRATASEDRHSVMLLLKLYDKCHTTVNWNAQARTSVPTKLSVFLSQRRRWSLGSATHGSWMIFMPNIPIWERFSSLVFVITYLINPFLMYSAVTWITTMISGKGDATYYIFTGVVQVVTLYKLLIPVWCPLSCWERAAYYLFYLVYLAFGPFLGIMVLCYSIYNMDDFGWGKTRKVKQDKQKSTMLGMVSPVLTNITNMTCGLETMKPFPVYKLHSPYTTTNNLSPRPGDPSGADLYNLYNAKTKTNSIRFD